MTLSRTELERLQSLSRILSRARAKGVRGLDTEELGELSDLYRHACSVLSRLESRGENPQSLAQIRRLASASHGVLFRGLNRPAAGILVRVFRMLVHNSPRAIRAEWKLLMASFLLMYGLAIASYIAVTRDLSMAFSLLDPAAVSNEIQQLTETAPGETFRGNFTFGVGDSPRTAAWIMLHNMGVGVLFFVSALIAPLYLWILATNGLMLGTYTGVAGHWDQAGSISSILWCHGVIEIQTFVLAATAGLVLLRAFVSPGARTRAHALKLEARRAWELFAPVFPLLFIAGLIEGFITPHMPLQVRLTVAIATGIGLVLWVGLGGRGGSPESAGSSTEPTRIQPGRQQRAGGFGG